MEFVPDFIIRYCQYQPRCHKEVKERLAKERYYETEADAIIALLIDKGHLNETMFAKSFARGKFRLLKWGRNKIKAELRKRQISEYNVKAGLKEIEEESNRIKDEITCAMGAAERITYDGETVATWKNIKPSVRIDVARIRRERPDLFVDYSLRTSPTRRFVLEGL
jgi:hypothetical protein